MSKSIVYFPSEDFLKTNITFRGGSEVDLIQYGVTEGVNWIKDMLLEQGVPIQITSDRSKLFKL